jgi:hypothetical protein
MPNSVVSSIPVMQIRDGYVLVYYEQLYSRRWSNKFENRTQLIQVKEKAYSGDVTQGARKRMSKAITLMSQIVKPKLITNPISNRTYYHRFSFVTLTVSSNKILTARQGYDLLLQHFIQWLRRTKNIELYVWKAEAQLRGQIHWHFVWPDFIHYREIRNKWNALQKAAGLLDDFAMEHGHFDPNSTDIHETRDVTNMRAYIMKEMGKSMNARKNRAEDITDSLIKAGELPEAEREKFIDEYKGDLYMEGKVWDCSACLGAGKYYSVAMTQRHEDFLDNLCKLKQAREKKDDFYSMVFFGGGKAPPGSSVVSRSGLPLGLLNDFEQDDFDRHLDRVINPPVVEPKKSTFQGYIKPKTMVQAEFSLN